MKVKIVTRIIIVINENNIFVYMHNYIHFLKVVYLKFGLKSFALRGLLDELLNKFLYPGIGSPMNFIHRDLSSCSFRTWHSFLHPGTRSQNLSNFKKANTFRI